MSIKHSIILLAAVFVQLLNCFSVSAQNNFAVSGFVTDANSGERLAGATVHILESIHGTSCNDFGFFSLTISSAPVKILFRFVGYEPFTLEMKVPKDTVLNIQLHSNNNIEEIKVSANPNAGILASTIFGIHRLGAKEVGQMPAVLGEPDILKSIQFLPGVSFSTEGSTGFSVRGGSPDNTLIQLDGVPVYNVNHLWGFMSAFNNDAISETQLYKGNLPARFGGRLGSVLDVRMKEGNLKKRTGTFSLSPIAGRYTLEGPILRDKISFMLSGRSSWANLLLSAIQSLENKNRDESQFMTYGFWDINAKTNWIINQNNRLYLSFYTGKDAFVTEDRGRYSDNSKFSYSWQNLTSVLRWNHLFSSTLFANFSAYNSRFRQEYLNRFDKNGQNEYLGYNNLNDWTLKGDFDWFPGTKYRARFGFQLSMQKFSPEIISIKSDSTALKLNTDIFTRNLISEVYFENEIDITEKLKGNFGLRGWEPGHTNKKLLEFTTPDRTELSF